MSPTRRSLRRLRPALAVGFVSALLLSGCASPSGGSGAAVSEEVPDVGLLNEYELP